MNSNRRTRPTPMPQVSRAFIPLEDALGAVLRGQQSWNPSQLRDAIKSAEYFLDLTKKALDRPEDEAKAERKLPDIPMPTPGRNFRP